MRTLFDDDEQYIAHLERHTLRWQVTAIFTTMLAVVGWVLVCLGTAP